MNLADDIIKMHADWAREVTWVHRTETGNDPVTKEKTWNEAEEAIQAVIVEPKMSLEAMVAGGIERYDFELRVLPPIEIPDTDLIRFDGQTFKTVGRRVDHDGSGIVERVYRLVEVV